MSEQPRDSKQEIIKHSAAIQIQNNMTLLQRRIWNVLLFNAYPKLLTDDEYYISVKALRNILEYNSNDEHYLKEIIRALVTCTLEWNVLGKDGGTKWGIAALLADATIDQGICTYSYGAQLRKSLYNPTMYARLDLMLQNRFESKHSQALWELCVDYLGSARTSGETPFIPIPEFKKLMGVEDSYQSFKRLHEKVVKPAVAEINKETDLQVTVNQRQKGRKVEALKFRIHRVTLLPSANHKQTSLFPDLEDMPMVVKLLKDAGLSENDAWEFWQQGFRFVDPEVRPALSDNPEIALTRYVREKIHLLKQKQKAGTVTNPSGFLISALRKNFSNTQFEEDEATEQRIKKKRELQQLLRDQERLVEEQDAALHSLTDKIVDTFPDRLEQAAAALLEESSPGFRYVYQQNRTALQNYRGHRGVAVAIGRWLETHFTEEYSEVRKPYREQLEEIQAQISVLNAEGIHVKRAS